jgi:hypothetical protein
MAWHNVAHKARKLMQNLYRVPRRVVTGVHDPISTAQPTRGLTAGLVV